jgi:transcriptional regulator PpsR
MSAQSSLGQHIPFSDPDTALAGFASSDIIDLAYSAGDFILAVDDLGIVRDVASHGSDTGFTHQWVGQKWLDIVTVESRPKIQQLLEGVGAEESKTGWRQVNHPYDGDDIPVNYRIIKPQNGAWSLAIGRDLRAISILQQRLLKTQQSMERDYLHLRQTETRYRLLFDMIAYPVLIVDADTLEIQQANKACHALMGVALGAIDGKGLLTRIEPECRDDVVAYIGAISVNNATQPVAARLLGGADAVQLSASTFRQNGRQYWLVNIDDGQHDVPRRQSDSYILDVVERMPDAFVLADEKQAIIVANRAFADLVQAGSVEQLVGVSLNGLVGRPDIDLGLLKKQLRDHHNVRNFSSVITDLNGGEEPVEISAIMIERDQPLFGYSVRSVGRRERDLPQTGNEMPKSVDQLTDLVGRKTLKEIVRESTDLIERMCIEAALVHTSDNRASAAEILGLSRQSLYSKLHRHGLGNLSDRD